MAVIQSKKVKIVALKKYENEILEFLQESESFNAIDFKEEFGKYGHDGHNLDRIKGELDFCITFLSSHATGKREFKYKLLGDKELYSLETVKKIVEQFDIEANIKACKKLAKNINTIKSKNSEIKKEIDLLQKFESFNCDLNLINQSESTEIFIGEIKKIKFSLLQEELEKTSNLLEVVIIKSSKTNVSFSVIYSKSIKNDLYKIIGNFGVFEFKDYKKYINLSEYFKNAQIKLGEIDKEEIELKKEIENTLEILPKLKACHDYYSWLCDQKQTINKATFGDYVFFITGWIAGDKYEYVREKLNEITKNNLEIIDLKKEEGEKTPIEIKNNSIFQPFEIVTSLYGPPRENEFDPTPFISIFFWIFFAFCLTDALYGFILFLISSLALKFMIVPKETKPFINLGIFVGISTMIMGVLFGGYGGIDIKLLPSFLYDLQIFDMTGADKLKLGMEATMGLAFGLGFIHLLFGVILKGAHSWKEGNKASAIFMNFSWIAFFTAIGIEVYLGIPELYIWITVALMAISLSYDTKGFMKIIVGPFSILNEGISWGSNILSYARLFALGISTGIIAIVFNQIALTLGGMLPPVVSHLIIVLIILIGHILNIAMNSLGAFIHSARLQFVEFYGKFMEGGGVLFDPLKRKSTFVYLKN